MKRAFLGVSLVAVVSLAASIAGAATVTNVDNVPAAWGHVNLGTTLSTGDGGVWALPPTIRAGNIDGITRSPFDGSGNGGVPVNAGWAAIPYYAVGPDNPFNPAVLNFARDQQAFSFLWGSVDNYNELTFLDNNVVVATVLWSDLAGAQIGVGASFVRVTDLIFDQIRFLSSPNNYFEFSNIETSPVPIPAALPLFGSVLAGMGLFRWWKRRTPATA
jgi:hypothetical protein